MTKPTTTIRKSKKPLRGWRRIVFPLMAVVAGVAFVGLIEVVLVVADVGRPQDYVDPFVGFSAIHPLFGPVAEDEVYRTEASRLRYFESQEFALEKPSNGFRMFFLGGSTVRGRPYQVTTAFPSWLQLELQARNSEHTFEAVNCGGLSYASYRLIPILKEVLKYQTDLVVVATGHNEFLEDRTYQEIKQQNPFARWFQEQAYSLRTVTLAREAFGAKRDKEEGVTVLPEEVTAALDSRTGYASYHYDREWQAGVIEHFEQSLRTMVDMCQDADVPLILVKLGANLRDCPPFKSELRPDIEPENELAWYEEFSRGTELDERSPSRALEHYRAAEAIEGEHSLLAFRIARCLDRLGRPVEAGLYYRRAKDWDVCPLRIFDSMQEIVERIAEETDTPLVDVRQLLVDANSDGIPGYDLFMDHVHPTIGVHQKIAASLADAIAASGLVQLDEFSSFERRMLYRNHIRALESSYFSNGGRRVQWLEGWAQRQRLIEETGPVDERGLEDYGHRCFDFEDLPTAFDAYEAACEMDPNSPRRILDHAFELFQQGRPGDASLIVQWIRHANLHDGIDADLTAAEFVVAVELEEASVATAVLNEHRELLSSRDTRDSSWLATAAETLPRFEAGGE